MNKKICAKKWEVGCARTSILLKTLLLFEFVFKLYFLIIEFKQMAHISFILYTLTLFII